MVNADEPTLAPDTADGEVVVAMSPEPIQGALPIHIPSGVEVWDAEDEAYDSVDLTGCRNLSDRLVRIAETLGRPINVSRTARFLIRTEASGQSVTSLRCRIYEEILSSEEFVVIGGDNYQFNPMRYGKLHDLPTNSDCKEGQYPLQYGQISEPKGDITIECETASDCCSLTASGTTRKDEFQVAPTNFMPGGTLPQDDRSNITSNRDPNGVESTSQGRPSKPSYGQDWPAYNTAQCHEKDLFVELLHELCARIPQPPSTNGRPRLPLSDVVFGLGLKVYSGMSTRRAMTDLRNAQNAGWLDALPSFTTVCRYMEDPELKPLLRELVQLSALPLQSVERDFAIDSTGFASSVYNRWFDHKWGKERKEHQWVKTHLMCGVFTNVVTDVDATETDSNDLPYMVPFVETTGRHFNISEVSADKAYLSRDNLRSPLQFGGTAYIPFKSNSRPIHSHDPNDQVWTRAYHFFNLHRAEFLSHYHKRSNVETTIMMIKAKFGPSVRSRNPAAQVNGVLTKVLCHNVCVLVQAMHELKITPDFRSPGDTSFGTTNTFGANSCLVPKPPSN